jgi:hypothetical protein
VRKLLLLASAGKFAVISVLGDIDATGADALASAFDWLDGEGVIIVSLESCTAIDGPAFDSLLPRTAEPQIVYVLPAAPGPRQALRVASYVRSLHVVEDLDAAVRLASSLEGSRLLPFRPLKLSSN